MELRHSLEEERHLTILLLWNDEGRLFTFLRRSDAKDLSQHGAQVIHPKGVDLGVRKIPDLEGEGLLCVTLLYALKNLGGADTPATSMDNEFEPLIPGSLNHWRPWPQ